jgi:membrane-bound metal-dependent hydrolase YbcI (DUF457 family)
MKKPADLAILAIGIYVFHQIVLSVVLLDYVTVAESLKWFTPIGPLTEDFYGGVEKFYDVLKGIINLALVGVMVFMIIARGKDSAPTKGLSASDFGTPTSQQ